MQVFYYCTSGETPRDYTGKKLIILGAASVRVFFFFCIRCFFHLKNRRVDDNNICFYDSQRCSVYILCFTTYKLLSLDYVISFIVIICSSSIPISIIRSYYSYNHFQSDKIVVKRSAQDNIVSRIVVVFDVSAVGCSMMYPPICISRERNTRKMEGD